MKIQNVLVVGGGIGGLSAAAALSHVGCEVTVIETKPDLTVPGIGIIQPSNALNALNTFGAAKECLEIGYAYKTYRWYNADGTFTSEIQGPSVNGFPPYNGVRRRDLHDILTRRARALGAQIHLGTRIEGLTSHEDRADVVLSNGTQSSYDLVIGADGIYSDTRQRLFGQILPRPTGQSVWRVMLPKPAEMTSGVMYVGQRTKTGLIPLSEDAMYLLLVSEEDPTAQMRLEDLHELLLARMAGYDGTIGELRQLIVDPSQVVYRPMEVVMLPPPWHVGRCVLIGDSAHASTPHLGQGAAMAIEDAVVLADIVRGKLSWADTIQEYMRRRYARANLIQSASLTLGEYEQGLHPNLNVFKLMQEVKLEASRPI